MKIQITEDLSNGRKTASFSLEKKILERLNEFQKGKSKRKILKGDFEKGKNYCKSRCKAEIK